MFSLLITWKDDGHAVGDIDLVDVWLCLAYSPWLDHCMITYSSKFSLNGCSHPWRDIKKIINITELDKINNITWILSILIFLTKYIEKNYIWLKIKVFYWYLSLKKKMILSNNGKNTNYYTSPWPLGGRSLPLWCVVLMFCLLLLSDMLGSCFSGIVLI